MRPLLVLVTLLCCAVGVPLTARAATYCEISSASIAFGSYDAFGPERRDTVGSITVTCTGSAGDRVTYSLTLDPGGQDGLYRTMTNGTHILRYMIYTDNGYTQAWKDGSGGSSCVSDSFTMTTSRSSRTYPMFGRIPAGQRGESSGTYRADLTVTLTY